jgi:hypothetical protein
MTAAANATFHVDRARIPRALRQYLLTGAHRASFMLFYNDTPALRDPTSDIRPWSGRSGG